MKRYYARAVLANGKYSTHYGRTLAVAVAAAEKASITGKAHHGMMQRIGQYGNWQDAIHQDIYGDFHTEL